MEVNNNHQLNCNIVLDLLPNYIEHVTSASTDRDIEEHLDECENCKTEYLNMVKNMNIGKLDNLKEVEIVKDGFVKTRRMYMLRGIVGAIVFLSLLVPGIVNYSIDKRFTWYYIVISSLFLLFAIVGIAIFKRNNKILASLGMATVLLPLYLFILEILINRYFLNSPVYWFKAKALPTYCVWTVIIWITFILIMFTNINNAYCIGLGFAFSIIGAILTNGIFLRESLMTIVKSSWISILACCICTFIAIMVGFFQSVKK